MGISLMPLISAWQCVHTEVLQATDLCGTVRIGKLSAKRKQRQTRHNNKKAATWPPFDIPDNTLPYLRPMTRPANKPTPAAAAITCHGFSFT